MQRSDTEASLQTHYTQCLLQAERGQLEEAAQSLETLVMASGNASWPMLQTLLEWHLKLGHLPKVKLLLKQFAPQLGQEPMWQWQCKLWLAEQALETLNEYLPSLKKRFAPADWLIEIEARLTLKQEGAEAAWNNLSEWLKSTPSLTPVALELLQHFSDKDKALLYLEMLPSATKSSQPNWAITQPVKAALLAATQQWEARLLHLEACSAGAVSHHHEALMETILEALLLGGKKLPAVIRPWLDRFPHLRTLQSLWGLAPLARQQAATAQGNPVKATLFHALELTRQGKSEEASQVLRDLGLRRIRSSELQWAMLQSCLPLIPEDDVAVEQALNRWNLTFKAMESKPASTLRREPGFPLLPSPSLTTLARHPAKLLSQFGRLAKASQAVGASVSSPLKKGSKRLGVVLSAYEPAWAQLLWLKEALPSLPEAKLGIVFTPRPVANLAEYLPPNWQAQLLPAHPGLAAERLQHHELSSLWFMNPTGDPMSYALALNQPVSHQLTGGPFVSSTSGLDSIASWTGFGLAQLPDKATTLAQQFAEQVQPVEAFPLVAEEPLKLGEAPTSIESLMGLETAPELVLLAWPWQLHPSEDEALLAALRRLKTTDSDLPVTLKLPIPPQANGSDLTALLAKRLVRKASRLTFQIEAVPVTSPRQFGALLNQAEAAYVVANGGMQWALPLASLAGLSLMASPKLTLLPFGYASQALDMLGSLEHWQQLGSKARRREWYLSRLPRHTGQERPSFRLVPVPSLNQAGK